MLARHRLLENILALALILLGLVWQMVKLPDSMSCYKANLLLLAIFFIMIFTPDRINIWTAWFIGILADSLNGFVLGNQAIQLAFVATIISIFHKRIRLYTILQDGLIIMFMGLVISAISIVLYYVTNGVLNYCNLYSVVPTIIVWPFFYLIVGGLRNIIYRE